MSDFDSMVDRRLISALLKWAVIIMMAYGYLFYSKWRRRPRMCPHCRREFKGKTSGACPACGERL